MAPALLGRRRRGSGGHPAAAASIILSSEPGAGSARRIRVSLAADDIGAGECFLHEVPAWTALLPGASLTAAARDAVLAEI